MSDLGQKEHFLKTWPVFFNALLDGSKTFEVRKNDRGFQVGDILALHEFVPATGGFTGRSLSRRVTYILEGSGTLGTQFGLQVGYVIMGLAPSVLSGGDEQSTSPLSEKPSASVKATGQELTRVEKITLYYDEHGHVPAGLFPVEPESLETMDTTGQKSLSVILDEIEADQQKMTWLEACDINKALVKALREALKWIEILDRDGSDYEAEQEITAILTESDKALGEKEA